MTLTRLVSHTKKWQFWLAIIFILLAFFAKNNYTFYKTPIAKVTKVTSDKSYEQTLKVCVLNGEYKGKSLTINNKYSYSRVADDKLNRGTQIFLSITETGSSVTANTEGVRRDYYAVWSVLIFIYLVVILAGRRGIKSLISVTVNIVIFLICITLYDKGKDLIGLSLIMMIIFTFATLLISNGIKRTSFISILSTLITMFFVIGIFNIVMRYGKEIDYAALDYIVGNQSPEVIFAASISIAGLGAVMDVAISIAASLSEIVKKGEDVTVKKLLVSGREIGHDIMGTMINVLLFTYICGLMPLMIVKMKNDISLFTILRLQVPFEICRFLLGGIAILLAIPVSIFVTTLSFKLAMGKVKTKIDIDESEGK
jgi:uncharacterized membrane protein